MFDDLLLLTKGGNTVFFGPIGPQCIHLIDYFEDRGANPISFGENPAAWMLRAQTAGAAADVNCQLINMSLGGPVASPNIRDAVQYAAGKGVIMVCAAGNEGDNNPLTNEIRCVLVLLCFGLKLN